MLATAVSGCIVGGVILWELHRRPFVGALAEKEFCYALYTLGDLLLSLSCMHGVRAGCSRDGMKYWRTKVGPTAILFVYLRDTSSGMRSRERSVFARPPGCVSSDTDAKSCTEDDTLGSVEFASFSHREV